jgi:hypothetical protein
MHKAIHLALICVARTEVDEILRRFQTKAIDVPPSDPDRMVPNNEPFCLQDREGLPIPGVERVVKAKVGLPSLHQCPVQLFRQFANVRVQGRNGIFQREKPTLNGCRINLGLQLDKQSRKGVECSKDTRNGHEPFHEGATILHLGILACPEGTAREAHMRPMRSAISWAARRASQGDSPRIPASTGGGTRTLKTGRTADFESAAFAIPPLRQGIQFSMGSVEEGILPVGDEKSTAMRTRARPITATLLCPMASRSFSMLPPAARIVVDCIP